ncbi:Bcl-2-interacting killer [Galemys pyrenaicus]|uniref:Bcl-2-interacting killer n=1 Tax=Galemys pyrenaicus TaxID=202257 RepID=A0A8J6DRD3_GALPY|nr:Bcl-2-interacting killer [Galemys pyrenaicus]
MLQHVLGLAAGYCTDSGLGEPQRPRPGSPLQKCSACAFSPREDMSRAGPVSRNLFWDSLLYEQATDAAGVPGMTDVLESSDPESPGRDSSPDDVAMRLAFIGDEMEVRWTLPHIAQLPGMAVHSLTFTYNQTGLRGVLRSFISGLLNLRENIRFWSFLIFRDRVRASRCCDLDSIPALGAAEQPLKRRPLLLACLRPHPPLQLQCPPYRISWVPHSYSHPYVPPNLGRELVLSLVLLLLCWGLISREAPHALCSLSHLLWVESASPDPEGRDVVTAHSEAACLTPLHVPLLDVTQ